MSCLKTYRTPPVLVHICTPATLTGQCPNLPLSDACSALIAFSNFDTAAGNFQESLCPPHIAEQDVTLKVAGARGSRCPDASRRRGRLCGSCSRRRLICLVIDARLRSLHCVAGLPGGPRNRRPQADMPMPASSDFVIVSGELRTGFHLG